MLATAKIKNVSLKLNISRLPSLTDLFNLFFFKTLQQIPLIIKPSIVYQFKDNNRLKNNYSKSKTNKIYF